MALDVLDIDFSGTTDANGNLSVTKIPSPAYWCVLKMVAQTTGAPEWAVQVNQRSVTFGRGRRVDLGPIPIQPKDEVQVVVTGAQPNVSVTGKLLGVTGQLQDVIGSYAPSPNTIAMDTVSQILLTDRIDTSAGSGSKSYNMPPGAQTIMVNVDQDSASRNVGPTQILVRCFPSDFIAVQIGGASINLNTQALGLLNPRDTTFDVEWTMVGANPLNTFLDVTVLTSNPQKPQNIPFQFFGANQNLGVTEESANPASWQAANLTNAIGIGGVVAGTTTTIIAGTAGLTTRLYRVRMGVVASAGSSITIECPTGTVRAQIDASRTQDFDGDFGKVACGVNASLAYTVHGANASVSGGFGSVSQA